MLYCSNKLCRYVEELNVKPSNCFLIYEALPLHENNPRSKWFSEYKIQNKTWGKNKDGSLSYRFARYMSKQGFKICPSPSNMEADDMAAYMVEKINKRTDIGILTTDHDLLQLVSDNVKVFLLQTKGIFEVNKNNFGELYKDLEPWMLKYYKALWGDPDDCYKGVNGIGKKGALKILQDFFNWSENWAEKDEEMIVYLKSEVLKRDEEYRQFKKSLSLAKLYPSFIKVSEEKLKRLELEIKSCL